MDHYGFFGMYMYQTDWTEQTMVRACTKALARAIYREKRKERPSVQHLHIFRRLIFKILKKIRNLNKKTVNCTVQGLDIEWSWKWCSLKWKVIYLKVFTKLCQWMYECTSVLCMTSVPVTPPPLNLQLK